jgi:hypothetical protein
VTSMPRHPGSRQVPKPPNLVRSFKELEARLAKLAALTRPETLTAVPASPTRWEPATAATMTNVLRMRVYRSGSKILADVGCGTGAGSVMSVQLTCPDLGVSGAAATTASGGTERIVRVTLDLPTSWESGAVHAVYVQAMRVSGADSTTCQVLRAWQR